MQDASAEFDAAVAAHRTWVPPQLRTDWDGTGYAGDGTIDDLTPQMGNTWEVDHTLDDGYPDTVAFVSGTSVPELTAELVGRSYPAPTPPVTAAAYWSPLRADSPVYGFDRDIAPITLEVGLVTEAGIERVPVFTGQMVNTPVKGGRAELKTISATRLKLMRLVQIPAFASIYSKGIHTTWPVSFALVQSGIYAGPQIRDDCAWYAPMHGSAWQMIPAGNQVFTYDDLQFGGYFARWEAYEQTHSDPSPILIDDLEWGDGPYVAHPANLQVTGDLRRAMYLLDFDFEPTAPDAFSQAGHRARLEMWVRGDATNVNGAPGGSGSISRLCSLWGTAETGTSPEFRLGITPTRNVEARVFDGANTRTLTSTGTLPTDGEWYFIGAAYDMAADRLWVNLGGTVESSSASMVTTNLPATEQWDFASGSPVFLSALPVSDITLTTGPEANVDDYPLWRDDESFAPTATLPLSPNRLVALAETEPREAWQIVTDYATSELASVRLTETDAFEYLPLGWWVRDEQQEVSDLFATNLNAAQFDIDLDPTKIRNSIKVSYTETSIIRDNSAFGFSTIFELDNNAGVTIPPGITVIKFNYSAPGILPAQSFLLWDNTPLTPPNLTQVTLCDTDDGTGVYAVTGQVEISFDAWEAMSATIRFVNLTRITWHLVNDADFSPLIIVGVPVVQSASYVTDFDAVSVATRGERALEVPSRVLQTSESARRLARNLKMALRKAVPTIGADQQGIEVLGDPRRRPGDLALFRDTVTGVDDGQWRLRGVLHRGDGATYRQQVIARQTHPIMIIGEGLVGESLIGPSE